MLGDCKIQILNKEYSKTVQTRLFELGYMWGGSLNKKYQTGAFIIFTRKFDQYLTYTSDPYYVSDKSYKDITLTDLYKVQKEKSLQLNDEYKAVVKDGYVQVGCQQITFDKIKELNSIIDKNYIINKYSK